MKAIFPGSDTRPTQVGDMDPWPVTWPNLSDLIGWGQKFHQHHDRITHWGLVIILQTTIFHHSKFDEKKYFVVIRFLAIRSLQNFAHTTCHVQTLVTITQCRQKEISNKICLWMDLEFRWKHPHGRQIWKKSSQSRYELRWYIMFR